MAAYVAFAKLPKVPVEPRADVLQSSIPAICKSFLGTGADTIPVPLGAGMSLTQMEPHLPVTLVGTVWGLPILFPQKPRRTGNGQFGQNDCSTDSGGNLFGTFYAK